MSGTGRRYLTFNEERELLEQLQRDAKIKEADAVFESGIGWEGEPVTLGAKGPGFDQPIPNLADRFPLHREKRAISTWH